MKKNSKSDSSVPNDAYTIKGDPSKLLVARVITKDIQLEDAVLDLIDNSIDGARRHGGKSLAGYFVTVTMNPKEFSIKDNCGGIDYALAKNYAFRFGRPADYEPLSGPSDTVGNFGIGMKRALLKLGRYIHVDSRTTNCHFAINIDVLKWLKDEKNWRFKFSKIERTSSPKAKCGTTIKVTGLYAGVSERFSLRQTTATLLSLIKDKQAFSLNKKLKINVNDNEVDGVVWKLGETKKIRSLLRRRKSKGVLIEMYAGIDESDNDRAGWYVICNGRTLLRADRSSVTGWGNRMDGSRVPSYHHQYARFRGYLIFHSDNPNDLPWNTTKTGVDAEHELYRGCLPEMVMAMKQVFGFLNSLDKESDSNQQPLTAAIKSLESKTLEDIRPSKNFIYPGGLALAMPDNKLKWIRFQRPTKTVEAAMTELKVDRPDLAGERTFDVWCELNLPK